jgi:site-specific DNA recombinase
MRRGRQARLRSGQLLPWTRAPYGYRLHPERPRDPAAVQVDPVAAGHRPGAVRRVRGRWGDPAHPGRPAHRQWRADPNRQADLAVDHDPQPVDQPGLQGSGGQRSAAHHSGPPPLVGAGTGRQGRQHPSPPAPGVDHRPGPGAGLGWAVRPGRQAAGRQPAGRPAQHHPPYLLRGLVSCGVCRLSCSGVTRTATDTRYRYYRCRGKQARVSSGRASCCPARFIPATQLDELVWADLCAVLEQPQLVAQALQRAHSGAWVPQELRRRQATLRSVRASVARQRQRLLEAYLAEVIDLAAFQRQDRTLAGQEADLLAREREVAAQANGWSR